MVLKRFGALRAGAARKGAFTAFMMLATACATSTHPPSSTAAAASRDPSPDDLDDDDVEDRDGEVEATSELADDKEPASPCPTNMVLVGEESTAPFCIDKYEASLVEVDADGNDKPYPHWHPVDGHTVRAVSAPGVFPQGFISEVQAEDACAASGKRLCSYTEWKAACMGPSRTTFPYGNTRQPGVCHDAGKSAVAAVFGFQRLADPIATSHTSGSEVKAVSAAKASSAASPKPSGRQPHVVKKRAAETTYSRAVQRASATAEKPSKRKGGSSRDKTARSGQPSSRSTKVLARHTPAKASTRPASVEPSVWTQLNDPRLGQVEGALARTGSHEACVNGYGVVDMVGNLHEWVKTDAAAPHGTFAGGYYLDTSLNGDGCQYRTTAHAHDYHDYSTGFRCCADARTPHRTE